VKVIMYPLRRTALAAALATIFAATAISAGCVTINIYFPAAAVEKAADRIIDEIYQSRKDAPASSPTPAAKPGETK
jgi:hypothetical protein